MEHKHLSEAAAAQLDRVLAFFPRADAKGSVLLAVDTGMLAVLASNSPASSSRLDNFNCLATRAPTWRQPLALVYGCIPESERWTRLANLL